MGGTGGTEKEEGKGREKEEGKGGEGFPQRNQPPADTEECR